MRRKRPYIRSTTEIRMKEDGGIVAFKMIAVIKPYRVRQLTIEGRNVDKRWARKAFLASLRREGLRPEVDVTNEDLDVQDLDVIDRSTSEE